MLHHRPERHSSYLLRYIIIHPWLSKNAHYDGCFALGNNISMMMASSSTSYVLARETMLTALKSSRIEKER